MIKINLLPESYRKPTASSASQLARSPLALLILGTMAAAVMLLVTTTNINRVKLSGVQSKLQDLEPRKAQMETLMKSVQQLRDQKVVFEQLVQSRSQWARYLNRISDVTPDGVWFTDLQIDPDKGLVLQGSAIGQGGEEMMQIGRFAQDLKSDAVFSAAVHDIQIQSIESSQDNDVEVVRFTLTGTIAGAAPPVASTR